MRNTLIKGRWQKNIFGFAIALLFFILPSYSGYSWSSTELTGYFTTHQFLTRAAYRNIIKHPVIAKNLVHFPSLEEIEKYEGVTVNLSAGLKIEGNGPDNPQNSNYDDHYFNPSLRNDGAGNCPNKVSEYYLKLIKNLRVPDEIDEAAIKEAAHNAAYLAHYIQDMSCPFHVIGSPGDMTDYEPSVPGPYIKEYGTGKYEIDPFNISMDNISTNPLYLIKTRLKYKPVSLQDYWKEMINRFRQEEQPGANWFEPNYYDGPDIEGLYTYFSTHFLYEAVITPYHNITGAIDSYGTLNNINEFGQVWNKLPEDDNEEIRAKAFAKHIAQKTKASLDAEMDELMFNPKQMGVEDLPYNLLAFTGIGKKYNIPFLTVDKIKNSVPEPAQMWRQAISATYTLWRASFSALYLTMYKDLRVIKTGNNPDRYIVGVRVRNFEPNDSAREIKVKILYYLRGTDIIGEKQLTGVDFGEINVGTVGSNKISGWSFSKNPITIAENDLNSLVGIDVTGIYKNVPDAGQVMFVGSEYQQDLISGNWFIEETGSEVSMLFDPQKKTYECKLVSAGDLLFYKINETIITGIKSDTGQDILSAGTTDELKLTGTELGYEKIETSGGDVVRGKSTMRSATMIFKDNRMNYITTDDNLHFRRIKN